MPVKRRIVRKFVDKNGLRKSVDDAKSLWDEDKKVVDGSVGINKLTKKGAAKEIRLVEPVTVARDMSKNFPEEELDKVVNSMYVSRVGKGKMLLPNKPDFRTKRSRRFREAYRQMVIDNGGFESTSEIQRALFRRAAGYICVGEEVDVILVTDPRAAFKSLNDITKGLVSIARTLGLERKAKVINNEDPVVAYMRDQSK